MRQSRLPTSISLFTGAGGLDVGLEEAGFRTVAATDNDPVCVASLVANQSARIPIRGCPARRYLEETRLFTGDVAGVSAADLRPHDVDASWTPDLLCGGPPCQPFSSAGSMRGLEDPRGRLFEHFVRLANELRPRVILFENVRGLVTMPGPSGIPGETLMLVRQAFEAIGYWTRLALLNSADFGAPQRRVRCFMLAARDGSPPEFPDATHSRSSASELLSDRLPWVTLGQFLATSPTAEDDDLIRPTQELEALLRGVPDGSGLKSAGAREPTRPGGHWGYKQGTFISDPRRPARTVTTTTPDWIRLRDGSLRRLTWRECAELQGFPTDWRFSGGYGARQRQIGNAVPVIFGRVLGQAIRTSLARSGSDAAESAPLPADLEAAISYTRREHRRNQAVRLEIRRRIEVGEDSSALKGLGSAERAPGAHHVAQCSPAK